MSSRGNASQIARNRARNAGLGSSERAPRERLEVGVAAPNGSDTRCPHGMAGMNPAGSRLESDHQRSDHRASSAQVTEAA